MAVLFFLPWVATDNEVQVGCIRLIPYVRGEEPGEIHGVPQEILDAVLGSYGNQTMFPNHEATAHVTKATILIWSDDVTGLEVAEEAINPRLEQGNYLAFSALAMRRVCANVGYCNSDGYQVIAQRFQSDDPGATSLTTRRRDGHGIHYVRGAPVPRFVRPHHVQEHLLLDFDHELMRALAALPDSELKSRIDEAIDSFLRANTDSPSMRERSEMVLMRIAFETILGANHDTGNLRQRFNEHFGENLPTPPIWTAGLIDEAAWRSKWRSNVHRPLDAWVQDFCASRNAAAHGPQATREQPLWPRHNHLLFSSWLFPLIVKQLLAAENLFRLSEEDTAARTGFEAFFGHDLLAYSDEDERHLWWNRVESDLLFPLSVRRIQQQIGEE